MTDIHHIGDLTPDPRNARKHNPRNIGQIENSLRKYGAARSIVIDEAGQIIAGHGVVEAAALAGIERVQVVEGDGETIIAVRRKGLTRKQKQELGVADNRGAELAEWDADMLKELAGEIDLGQFWAKDELDELLSKANGSDVDAEPQIDRAEELREKWGVETGQLWRLGAHRLLCGDSTKAEDVARVMEGEKADCTVTDPPYGVGVDYGEFKDTPENVKALMAKVMPIILEHLPAALTPGVPAMWDYPRPAWVGAWVHPAPSGGCPWGFVGNNPILFYGADPYLKAGKGRRPDSVVMASDRQGEDGHPTPKPLKVWEWLIERMTPNAGAIVFEPFCGSGTTIIACERLGRQCRAIEISPAYCAVTLERYQQATGQTPERI